MLTMRIVREGDLHLIIGRSLPSQFPSQIGRTANVHKNDLKANGVTAKARIPPFYQNRYHYCVLDIRISALIH